MSDASNISYTRRSDAPPEGERATLAAVYSYVLDCCARKEAAHPGGPDDGTTIKEDSANASIPETPRRAAT